MDEGCMDVQMYIWMYGSVDGGMNRCIDVWMDILWMCGWMDVWMDGWMDVWMDGMDGCMGRNIGGLLCGGW